MKRVKNDNVMQLITALNTLASEKQSKLWKRIAVELDKPTRSKREVNVFKLDSTAKDGETIIVPGKVLGSGVLTKKITVAALSFSESAREKISAQKGQALTIEELMKKNPEAKQIRIMG